MELKAFKMTKENISPKRFLRLTASEKANISSSKIIPPKLGSLDFGCIQVKYRNPVYRDIDGKPITR